MQLPSRLSEEEQWEWPEVWKMWCARKPELGWFRFKERMRVDINNKDFKFEEAFCKEARKSLCSRPRAKWRKVTALRWNKAGSGLVGKIDIGKNFLTVKTLKLWKGLSVESLESPSLKTFENRPGKLLSKMVWIQFLTESNPLAVITLVFLIDFKKW